MTATNEQALEMFLSNYQPSTAAMYRNRIGDFFRFTKNKPYDQITMQDAFDWKVNLGTKSSSTQRHYIVIMKTFFDWLCETLIVTSNVFAAVKAPNGVYREPAVLSLKESKKLIEIVEMDLDLTPDLKMRNWLIVTIMLGMGLRRAEVSNLNVSSYREEEGIAFLTFVGKGNKERVIKMPEKISVIMKSYIATYRSQAQASDPLFITGMSCMPNMKRTPANRLAVNSVDYIVNRYLRRAHLKIKGGKKVTAHTLRHTCFTTELAYGADLKSIQTQAGHTSLMTTQRYLHIMDGLVNSGVDHNPLFK